MTKIKKQPLTYKREKNKIEITGAPEDIKGPMWADLILSHLLWIGTVIILLFIIPKVAFIPAVIQWFRKYVLLFIHIVALMNYLHLFLSG